jgi:hypothetical protein
VTPEQIQTGLGIGFITAPLADKRTWQGALHHMDDNNLRELSKLQYLGKTKRRALEAEMQRRGMEVAE